MTHEEVIAQIDERRRAEARAKVCKSRVSREPIPGKPDAFAVRVDGRHVGLLRRMGSAKWSAVYLEDGADINLGTWHGKTIALQQLKQHVVREAERRVAAKLALAATIARDIWPHGLIADILLRICRDMLACRLSPAVASMNAVHALAEVTGVDASR